MGLLDEAIREHLELKRRRGAEASEVDRLEQEALGPVRRAPDEAPDEFIDSESPVAGAYPADEEVGYPLEDDPEWSDNEVAPAPFEHRAESAFETPAPAQWAETEPPTELAPLPARDYEPEPAPERAPDLPRHHEIAEEWEAHERRGLAGDPAGLQPDEPAPAPPTPAADPGPTAPPAGAAEAPVFGTERQRPAPGADYDLEQETVEHDVEAEELGHPRPDEPREGDDVLEETPEFLQDTPDHDRLWFEQRPPRDFDFDG